MSERSRDTETGVSNDVELLIKLNFKIRMYCDTGRPYWVSVFIYSSNTTFLLKNLLTSSWLFKNIKIKIYMTIILPVVYGCETWSLTLREERRLRVF